MGNDDRTTLDAYKEIYSSKFQKNETEDLKDPWMEAIRKRETTSCIIIIKSQNETEEWILLP